MKNTTSIKVAKKYEGAIESIEKIDSRYFLKLNNSYESLEGNNYIYAESQSELLFLIRHFTRKSFKGGL